ncbi:MAG: hypothetical protein OXE77_09910 [Flavobacteriaceae bacterium]|nr:hypothetical protein [Flavobacteriaceae bacterium]MCY4267675.1 hypothetical protein [Flavobacteriaceae bacterium]
MQIYNKVLYETTLPNIGKRWLDLMLPIHESEERREIITKQVKEVIEFKWNSLDTLNKLELEHGKLIL